MRETYKKILMQEVYSLKREESFVVMIVVIIDITLMKDLIPWELR